MDGHGSREESAEQIRREFRARFVPALYAAMRRAGAPNMKQFAEFLMRQTPPIRVSQQDLSAWAKGRIPEVYRLKEMERAVGVSWQWLLTGRAASGEALPPPEGEASRPVSGPAPAAAPGRARTAGDRPSSSTGRKRKGA